MTPYQDDLKNISSPSEACRTLKSCFPTIWREVLKARDRKKRRWPPWCFLTIDAARDIMRAYPARIFKGMQAASYFGQDPASSVSLLREMNALRLCLLAGWRAAKGIYHFDSDFCNTIVDSTRRDAEVPSEVLQYMPEWTLYMETDPFEMKGCRRTWILVTLTVDRGTPTLLVDSDLLSPVVLPVGSWSINDAVRRRFESDDSVDPATTTAYKELLRRALPLTLYVCSENADLVGPDGVQPRHPSNRKAQGSRTFASKIRRWEVGSREGPKLRRARAAARDTSARPEDGTMRRRPRPHTRVAHMHAFWVGKRSDPGKRRLVLKWVQATEVNAQSPDDLIETRRLVERAE